MIKNTIAALALAATLAQGALAATVYDKDGTSLDIFGRVQAMGLSKHASAWHRSASTGGQGNSIHTDGRLGIAARSSIADQVDAVAMAEWEMDRDGNGSPRARYMWAGIDGFRYGTLMLGKGDGAYYTIAGATDVFTFIESRSNDYFCMGDQLPGQVMYTLSSLGWDLRLSFQTAKNSLNDTPYSVRHGFGAAISARLAHDVTFAYGINYQSLAYPSGSTLVDYLTPLYARARRLGTEEARSFLSGHQPRHRYDLGAALSYGVLGDGLYVSLLYSATVYQHLPHKIYTYEAVASYDFDCGLGLKAGTGIQTYGGSRIVSDLDLGIYYRLGPCLKLFAEAQVDLHSHPERFLHPSAVKSRQLGESLYVVGAEYSF
ncbi:MAG: hypothetical protein K6A65_01890 [Succinivibrionaceae bacterium]|nr:hypothetical protein [Succinivibrionaceae bacterium]